MCTLVTTANTRRTKISTVTFITSVCFHTYLFVGYTTDFIKSSIVVVDGSTNDQDDIKQPKEELPLPWISLSIRNGDLFVPNIHHGTTSMGLK